MRETKEPIAGDERLVRLESAVESITASVSTLAKNAQLVAEKQDHIVGHLAKLDASRDRIPFSTLLSLHAAFVATLTVSLTIVIVVGSMALGPVRDSVSDVEKRLDRVEQRELDLAHWRGIIDERTQKP